MGKSVKNKIERKRPRGIPKWEIKKLVIDYQQGKFDASHNITHLENVADLTQLVGEILTYSRKEKHLCYLAGWLHDLTRSPSEDPASSDEEKSAQQASMILTKLSDSAKFKTSLMEREAITKAISRHTNFPPWFKDEKTRNVVPCDLEDRILVSLFIADYLEANGARVIARRCNFVGGLRLYTPPEKGGDLQKFGFSPGKDEGLVVAIESILRLTFINPEEFYPNYLSSLVHALYGVQREFVLGLFKGLNLKIDNLINVLKERRGPNSRTILKFRNIKAPNNLKQFRSLIEVRGGISDSRISQISDDVAHSALEALEYFSTEKTEHIDKAIMDWRPNGEAANRWKREMVEYQNRTWFKKMKRIFEKKRRRND